VVQKELYRFTRPGKGQIIKVIRQSNQGVADNYEPCKESCSPREEEHFPPFGGKRKPSALAEMKMEDGNNPF